MPQKKSKTYEVQIIGGIFSSRAPGHVAATRFQDLDFPEQNIQMVIKIDSPQKDEAYRCAVAKAIRNGDMLGSVHNATRPASILEVRALTA